MSIQRKQVFLHYEFQNAKYHPQKVFGFLIENLMTKRLFDIIFSLFGLIILSPILIIISIIIKLDSEGSILYKQTRVGKGNKDFSIYKFRTMKVGSEENFPLPKNQYYKQITFVGKYLRKYKLDELPQLINVIKGDMSFVGPRPVLRKFVDLYTKEQMHVLDIRPGITDLASIKYRNEYKILNSVENPDDYYINVIMQDKLALNLEYVNNHNVWIDIKLILQTVIPT